MTNELIHGFVTRRVPNRHFFFLEDNDGTEYFCHETDGIQRVNGHICFYVPGATVMFTASQNPKRPGQLRATNVQLVNPPIETDFPEYEQSTLFQWHGTHGWSRKDCGCTVFVSRAQIITFGQETLKPGSCIRHKTIQCVDKNGSEDWQASEIEIFIPQTT